MAARCDFLIVFIFSVIFALTACSKSEKPEATTSKEVNSQQKSINQAEPNAQKIDPCSLLTSEEIASVQGEPVANTHSSNKVGRGFLVSHCFFTLPTPANSISLALTQRGDGPDARDPKEFWKETFHRDLEAEETREKDNAKGREEEDEKKSPPEKIAGLGAEAFWMGTQISNALYVLKGDCFIRISVGGSGDVTSKLSKSKALAHLILKRL